jgi:tRNA pseudouridine32 synthase / 23S rRNA pseudouridine746 synthase
MIEIAQKFAHLHWRPSVVRCVPGPWQTALEFLVARFSNVSEAQWRERLAAGRVQLASGAALAVDAVYPTGELLHYWREFAAEVDDGLREGIVFQNEHLVVADKPHFMPVTPSGAVVQGALLSRLVARTGLTDLQPLHRIDAETAGLVAFGVRREERGAYQALFRDRQVSKSYRAVAAGTLAQAQALPGRRMSRIEDDPAHFMCMREQEGEPNSESRIAVLGCEDGRVALELEPVSGKRHQLRVHMAALGLPLLNDSIYPKLLPARTRGAALPQPLQLLAQGLAFTCPITGTAHAFVSELKLANWPAAVAW